MLWGSRKVVCWTLLMMGNQTHQGGVAVVLFLTGPPERCRDWTECSPKPIPRTERTRNTAFPHFPSSQILSSSPVMSRKVEFSHYPHSWTTQKSLDLKMRRTLTRPCCSWDIGGHRILWHLHGSSSLEYGSSLASAPLMGLRKSLMNWKPHASWWVFQADISSE